MYSLDNRKEERKQALITAFASDPDETYVVKCVIRDVSKSGCKLVSSEIGDLQDIIYVAPEGFKEPLLGKIVWRDKKFAGVEFIDEAERIVFEARKAQPKPKPLGFFSHFRIFSSRGQPRAADAAHSILGRTARSPNDFIAAVVHELRTPLTSLLGTLGLLKNGALGALPAKVMAALGIAFRNAGRLETLVDDMLDGSKIEAGKMDFDFAEVDIADLARECAVTNEAYAAKYGVEFKLDDQVGKASVRADAGRIEQVLTNLLSNGAKFSPEGAEVVVSLRRAESRIRVAVSNPGRGIPADMHDKIFDKFVQAQPASERAKDGTGLGLNISQAIVEKHGSRIRVQSEPGEGATFWFDLAEVGDADESPGLSV